VKLLIAVITCHRFKDRADVLRRTWVKDVKGADVRFFLGHGGVGDVPEDEVWVNAPDDYKSLRHKTQMAFKWAVYKDYDFIFKTDDDVYVIPERLLNNFTGHDYSGRVRAPSCENDAPRIYGPKETMFCSGFGYWLSQRAAKVVAYAPDNGDWAEDRYVGNQLIPGGIKPEHDKEFKLWPPLMGHVCSAPLGTCPACLLQYSQASVEAMHNIFKATGNIPVRLP
jgi:hypothetical protein